MRRIITIEELVGQIKGPDGKVTIDRERRILPLSINQAYKAIRRRENPLPHRKCGKRLLFDVEKVFRWFDRLPGKDDTL